MTDNQLRAIIEEGISYCAYSSFRYPLALRDDSFVFSYINLDRKTLFTTYPKISRLKARAARLFSYRQLVNWAKPHLNDEGVLKWSGRNLGAGFIGIGLPPRLRTHFYSTTQFNFSNKVVPKPVVNPGFLKHFHCKGLFTTTYAITTMPFKYLLRAWRNLISTCLNDSYLLSLISKVVRSQPRSGLIGIGLSLGLRTLF